MFQSARLKLTAWYCSILLLILLAFSLVLYTTETRNFARVVLQRNYGGTIPRKVSTAELRELGAQLRALRHGFVFDLFFIDSITLIIGGGLSYFLAGKTLHPIQQVLEKQKRFLADASHELRTPLSTIQTASEVILRSPYKSKDEYKKVIQQTYDEAKRLSGMANDLLLLSRIDAGTMPLKIQTVSLDKIAEEVIEQMLPIIKNKKLQINHSLPSDVSLRGDSNRLKQLVLILLDNAVKYTPKYGLIDVQITRSPKVSLSVRDTGTGITERDCQHIFDRFYQVDTSRSHSGAGLGLSIANSIIEAHHGSIKVESKIGKGSTFTVVFG